MALGGFQWIKVLKFVSKRQFSPFSQQYIIIKRCEEQRTAVTHSHTHTLPSAGKPHDPLQRPQESPYFLNKTSSTSQNCIVCVFNPTPRRQC